MKLLSAVFAVATVLGASDPQVAPRPAATPHPAVAATPRPAVAPRLAVVPRLTVPKGAVEVEPGTFHYTDTHGAKWIYRQTPFGIARFKDSTGSKEAPGKPVPAQDLYAGTKATADGDTIRFERPGPFGVYKWETNISDLNEMERAVWNRQLAKTPAQ